MYPHVMTNNEHIHGIFYVHDSAFSLPGDLSPCMHIIYINAEKESITPIISIRMVIEMVLFYDTRIIEPDLIHGQSVT